MAEIVLDDQDYKEFTSDGAQKTGRSMGTASQQLVCMRRHRHICWYDSAGCIHNDEARPLCAVWVI